MANRPHSTYSQGAAGRKEVFCSCRLAPPELGRQEGEMHLPQSIGTGKAQAKLSPTSAAAPRVAAWLNDWMISANQAGDQLRGSHWVLKTQVQVSEKSLLPSSRRLSQSIWLKHAHARTCARTRTLSLSPSMDISGLILCLH